MIQFLSEDSIVAIADGRNYAELSSIQSSAPIYSNQGITEVTILGKEVLPSFLITLDTGCTFISYSQQPEFLPFYTYMRPFSGLSTRYINTTYDLWKTQRFLIWNFNNEIKSHVIPKDLDANILDSLNNLKAVSPEEYVKFSGTSYRSRSGIHYFESKLSQLSGSSYTSGSNNGNFSGLTNEELVKLCKEHFKKEPSVKSIRQLLRNMKTDGINIPESFSKYRFGGKSEGYKVLQEIVFNDLPYTKDSELVLSEVISTSVESDKLRVAYLKSYKPTIVSVEKLKPITFIKIKSDKPVAIILKKEATGFNSEGICL